MKVRCNMCKKLENRFCPVKKATVGTNKKRNCISYEYDESKVKAKHPIHSTMRPDWVWDREERKRLIKEQSKREAAAKEQQDLAQVPNYMNDDKHPMTGDLSRFVSTAASKITGRGDR